MILFELRCGNDHHFEAWFRDNATYDSQVASGAVVCPVCGDVRVAKAIMAPRLNRATGAKLDAHDTAQEMRRLLGQIRSAVEASCDYVGDKFADEARKIHYGEAEARPIYGEASADESKALEEDGVEFARIPWVGREN
ncbi:DUF1178 family protein [Magnetospirillum moscoviense]|uniref:Uncharacterized protein n=1 Tax=Magnetospirillum moscoviense TaxID=1437059 RepID=A0A178MQU1_9PROT|nr:DUF1178 family protein [Magnetospirillum moscoviense]MBF0325672.1 DUF1178 family protein [Alphaproteobacteria bacterium]OAN51173.1 hypothetical protein A6A05_11295 [Magnetospirillum moscoviense]